MTTINKQQSTRPGWVDNVLYPFEDHYIEIDKQIIHYVDEGKGSIILMIHGNPTWSFVYRDVIKDLQKDYRCIAIDLPGFGLSEASESFSLLPEDHAKVLQSFVEKLGLSSITLTVQDWGGPIGLWVASQRPDLFSRLIVGNTMGWPVNGDLHFEMFSRMMGGAVGSWLIKTFNMFVNVMLPIGHKRRKLTHEEMVHYRKPLNTRRRRSASAILPREIIKSRPFLIEVEQGLSKINKLPALIIWADKDIAFRTKERERWEELLINSETHVLNGAGHFLQSDASTDFSKSVRTWMKKIDKQK